MNFKIVIQQDEDGRYNASCPELKGCHSFGDKVDEAIKNIREAIELYLDDMPEDQVSRIRSKVEFREIAV
ncbi:MAG: type II toxin-antitoxin system HicB family antitoxin [bacterium]